MKKDGGDHYDTDEEVYLEDQSESWSNIDIKPILVMEDNLIPVFPRSPLQIDSSVSLFGGYARIGVSGKTTSDIAKY